MPTAIEIFKFLPKKNCGECKHPTCLAFAMALANNKAKVEDCPYITEDGKRTLAASSAPPIRLVKVGAGRNSLEIGDETEIYRHEKKFCHPTRYSVILDDTIPDDELEARTLAVNRTKFERVGQIMAADMVAVRQASGDGQRFARAVAVVSESTDLPLLLMSQDAEALREASRPIATKVPLLHAATQENWKAMTAVAKELRCPLVVREDRGLNELADLVALVKAGGVEDIVLDFGATTLRELMERSTVVRKVSVKRTFRGLGYPVLVQALGSHAMLMATLATMKYGSIVAMEELRPEQALPLFVLRQNIYTDPQVPIQVKPDLYPVNNPGENAPILFTTNFSLTYFTVLADIEKSKVPAWLLVVDTEGLSVLTAFAAGKLSAEHVQKGLEKSGARVRSKTGILIIPGMVARLAPKLGEVTGMKVLVGPKESSGLPKFLKGL
jgi:acetyl-CoA decarbonylase/synthase complex subunit gamma